MTPARRGTTDAAEKSDSGLRPCFKTRPISGQRRWTETPSKSDSIELDFDGVSVHRLTAIADWFDLQLLTPDANYFEAA